MNKLTIEEVEELATLNDNQTCCNGYEMARDIAKQLLGTMRENELLREALEAVLEHALPGGVRILAYEALNPSKTSVEK